MPKKVPQKELDALIILVAGFPMGASLQDIIEKLTIALPRRTLQRRLATLVQTKYLTVQGSGKAVHYKLPRTRIYQRIAETAGNAETPGEIYIPISSVSKKVKQALRSAIQNHGCYSRTI